MSTMSGRYIQAFQVFAANVVAHWSMYKINEELEGRMLRIERAVQVRFKQSFEVRWTAMDARIDAECVTRPTGHTHPSDQWDNRRRA